MVFPVIGGDGKPTGYEIENSLRFNDGDSPSLQFTPSSDSNEQTWTVSFWVKRGVMGTSSSQMIFASDTNYDDYVFCRFCGTEVSNKTDMFQVFMVEPNGREGNVRTARLFRDPSAWYHIVVRCDLTQGTAADRLRIYVNGVKETSFDTASYLNQNDDNVNWNSNVPQAIGHQKQASSVERHLDGYLSEFYNIDGTSLGPDSFGETNDNGVWVPKQYTGSFGTNGYFLEFKQTGTSANSSGMGADTSGNDHHWTPANLAATDVTVDTPTNNFATVNSAIRPYSGESLSEGNLKATATHASVSGSFWGTIPLTNGKWYWECKITTLRNAHWIGVSDDLEKAGLGTTTAAARSYGIFYKNNGKKSIDETESNYGNTYAQGDIIGVALDMDNKNIYFSKNGTFQNSGDPTTGASGTGKANSSALEAIVLPACMQDNGDATVTEWNFGNPSFSISSGNADANGYGNFEYAVPSGYYSLCTKNLAEYG
jgi:hypothetical protein